MSKSCTAPLHAVWQHCTQFYNIASCLTLHAVWEHCTKLRSPNTDTQVTVGDGGHSRTQDASLTIDHLEVEMTLVCAFGAFAAVVHLYQETIRGHPQDGADVGTHHRDPPPVHSVWGASAALQNTALKYVRVISKPSHWRVKLTINF